MDYKNDNKKYEYKKLLSTYSFDFKSCINSNKINIIDVLIELSYKNSINISDGDFMSIVNILIDNIEYLEKDEKIILENIIEGYELYGHKTKKELINKNIINQFVYEKIDFKNKHLTKEQYELKRLTEKFILQNEKNTFLLSAPTSFGKSFIINAIIKEKLINKNKADVKILIMLPSKSLINEYYMNFIDINIQVISNPFVCNKTDKPYVFIGTPERVLLLDKSVFDIVIIDDIYFTSNFIEREKSFVLALKKIDKNKKILIVPNIDINSLEDKLKDYDINTNKVYKKQFNLFQSPVSNSHFNLKVSTEVKNDTILSYEGKQTIINHEKDKDGFISLAKCLNKLDEKYNIYEGCIIYHCNKSNASSALNSINIDVNDEVSYEKNILIKYIEENIHPESEIIGFLKKDKCIHNGNLDDFTREMIERLFINNEIKVLFATSTLSKGVNLPCKNIFFITKNHNRKKISDIDVKNTLGRAGRFKTYNHANRIIVNINKGKSKNDELFEKEYLEKQIKLEPGIQELDVDIKKVFQNDNRFSNEFKNKNNIHIKNSKTKSYIEYVLGYEKNNFLENFIKNNLEYIDKNSNKFFSYEGLKELFEKINMTYEKSYNNKYFYRSTNYMAYIYSNILNKNSIKDVINDSQRTKRKYYIKGNLILQHPKKNYEILDFKNKKHLNMLIYYYQKTFSDIQYEVRTFLISFFEIYKKLSDKDVNDIIEKIEHDTMDNLEIQLKNLGIRHKFLINNIIKKTKEKNFSPTFETGIEIVEFIANNFTKDSPEYFSITELHSFRKE